jgi:hypothetical protein
LIQKRARGEVADKTSRAGDQSGACHECALVLLRADWRRGGQNARGEA